MKLLLLVLLCTVVKSQYFNHTVIQNYGYGPGYQVINTTVVNTTLVRNPGYGPVNQIPQYGFRRNITQYDPYGGFVNQSITGRRTGNDLKVGNPGPYDVILYKQWFTKASRLWQIREKIITYPANPWENQRIITAVGIFDLQSRPGGHAAILSGGIGHRNVTIRLYSDRSSSFNYKIVIHGR